MVNTSLTTVFLEEEVEYSLFSDISFGDPITNFGILQGFVLFLHLFGDLNEEC